MAWSGCLYPKLPFSSLWENAFQILIIQLRKMKFFNQSTNKRRLQTVPMFHLNYKI